MTLIDDSRRAVFKQLWANYSTKVPFVGQLTGAFSQRSEEWVEDHIALRSLPGAHVGSQVLQGLFEALGYVRKDDYFFEDKQLKAFWLAPPDVTGHTRQSSPKIFISELIPDRFSQPFKQLVARVSVEVQSSPLARIVELASAAGGGDKTAAGQLVDECVALLTSPPAWSRPSRSDYRLLQAESEYAAWTLLFGPQVNHFTVSAHLLKTFPTIQALASYLEQDLAVAMNTAGGVVKGTKELQLEQISTKAAEVAYVFQDGLGRVPYGFVEFAYRYGLAGKANDGAWSSYYQGFVTSNADKIFESTFTR